MRKQALWFEFFRLFLWGKSLAKGPVAGATRPCNGQ